MKFKYLSLILVLLGFGAAQAQSILNAKSPEELRKMREENLTVNAKGDTVAKDVKPLDYGYINESDVLWSKVTWEVIDLNERINQPYYNSSDGLVYQTLSLFDALKKGIESGEITEVYDDEFFQYKITKDEAINALSRTDTTDWYWEQQEAGEDMATVADPGIDAYAIESDKIKMVKVKGLWYIDRRMSEMRYRIIGLSMMVLMPRPLVEVLKVRMITSICFGSFIRMHEKFCTIIRYIIHKIQLLKLRMTTC